MLEDSQPGYIGGELGCRYGQQKSQGMNYGSSTGGGVQVGNDVTNDDLTLSKQVVDLTTLFEHDSL